MDNGNLAGRYPAIVRSYDAKRRTCRVEIPGITSGGDTFTEAEIEYPIGDKSRTGKWETEIEILPNDTVWVDFIGGDPRYPVITGWRNPLAGTGVDWRRWHHKNIELSADENLIINAKTITLNGDIKLIGGGVTHDGVNISKSHKHGGVKGGPDTTGTPS
ncbi:MAG: hypothetical protein ACOYM1_11645 [Methylovulum sp.]|jgi:hypothetical protein